MRLTPHLKVLALFLLALFFALEAADLKADQNSLAAMDALLNSPTLDLQQARQALALGEALLLQTPAPPVALWTRLARVCFILGDLEDAKAPRQAYYEKGKAYAEFLVREQPAAVQGHYWLALNLAGLADVGGMLQGRQLLPLILHELQRSLALDETYDHAGAHRVLGRIYYEAPRPPFSVGDLQKSLRHLTAAARLAPEVAANHLYLAQTLIRLGKTAEARQELELVLNSTRPAVQPQDLRDDQSKARRLLAELGESK
jgi:tetratricopeptide (TPR) repeat protein